MRLSRAQRAALFAGNCPAVTGEGECPWAKGDTYKLSSLVSIQALRVDTATTVRGTSWRLHYLVVDNRDPARLIRRTPPVAHYGKSAFDQHGFPLPTTGEESAEASSYTAGGGAVISDAGEAVSQDVQKGLTEEARVVDTQRAVERRLAYEAIPLVDRLRARLEEAEALGLTPGRELARIEAAVAKLERTVKQAKQQRRAA